MKLQLSSPTQGFLNAPHSPLDELQRGDHVIIGAPYGTPYNMQGVHSDAANAPTVFRERANRRFGSHGNRYDFALGGTLLGDTGKRLVDVGDLQGNHLNLPQNALNVTDIIQQVVKRGGIPIVLGGDDSVPFPVARGLQTVSPRMNVLQIDAHIDYAEEAHGIRDGYSSTIRRISELPYVNQIVQVGARGTGSATTEDVQAARSNGNVIVPANFIHTRGIDALLPQLDTSYPWFITLDVDGLDPTIAPGTSCPLPGGLSYQDTETLLAHVAGTLGLIGMSVVEHFPSLDVRETTSVTLARLLSVSIGKSVRMEKP